jgi:hypothetical protein
MVLRLRALARVIRWDEPWELEEDDDLFDDEPDGTDRQPGRGLDPSASAAA